MPRLRSTSRTTAIVLAALLALSTAACAAKQDSAGAIGSVTPTGGATTAGAPTDGASASGAPTANASPTPILADGRSPVYLTKIDATKRTVTFDLIDFLTGDAAKKAWKKAYPGSSDDGPPNDYFIVNDNPKLRTLPVDASVTNINVVNQAAPTGNADKLVAFANATNYFLSIKPDQSDHRLAWNPFWITVQGGKIVKMEEQFLP